MRFAAILTFPDEILVLFLVDWFNLSDVARLDSACCSSICRSEFLSLLQHKFVTVKDDRHVIYVGLKFQDLFTRWIFQRQMKLSDLYLMPNNYNDYGELIYDIDLMGVNRLVMSLKQLFAILISFR